MTSFTVPGSSLKRITNQAMMAVYRGKSKIPILRMALLKWGGGRVSLSTTDLNTYLTLDADAETVGWGSCIINPLHLMWLAKVSGPDALATVAVDSDDGLGSLVKLCLTAGEISAKLNVIHPVDDFPTFVLGDDLLAPLTFSQADLHRLLTTGASAISTEETRYYLNGVFIHGIEGRARAVSTDGYRMALIDSDAPWWVADVKSTWRRDMHKKSQEDATISVDHGVIIPDKTSRILASILSPKANEPVEMAVSPTKLSACGPGWLLQAKLIDGTFPAYERIIPIGEVKASMTLSLASIRKIVASPFSTDRTRGVKFDLASGKATMGGPNLDGGCATAAISASGEAFEIGFNGRYVVDVLRALGGSAKFTMTSSGDPAKIYGEDTKAMFLLMPMRV